MPRQSRKNLTGEFFHLIVQGINKERIFESDKMKEAYKSLLRKNLKDTKINILAYCVMNNHVHILVHSAEKEQISIFMRKVNTGYAKLVPNQYILPLQPVRYRTSQNTRYTRHPILSQRCSVPDAEKSENVSHVPQRKRQ